MAKPKPSKYLTVGELIKILEKHPKDMPCIITDGGKDHQYGVNAKDIEQTDYAYFGNDSDAEEAFGEQPWYLNIGTI
jgi:hypothetical protein